MSFWLALASFIGSFFLSFAVARTASSHRWDMAEMTRSRYVHVNSLFIYIDSELMIF